MKKWLMEKDELGVERWLGVLFWFFVAMSVIGYAMVPVAIMLGW